MQELYSKSVLKTFTRIVLCPPLYNRISRWRLTIHCAFMDPPQVSFTSSLLSPLYPAPSPPLLSPLHSPVHSSRPLSSTHSRDPSEYSDLPPFYLIRSSESSSRALLVSYRPPASRGLPYPFGTSGIRPLRFPLPNLNPLATLLIKDLILYSSLSLVSTPPV